MAIFVQHFRYIEQLLWIEHYHTLIIIKIFFLLQSVLILITHTHTHTHTHTLIVIYEGLYFDLAQGQMNGAPNETRTHSCRFASLTC